MLNVHFIFKIKNKNSYIGLHGRFNKLEVYLLPVYYISLNGKQMTETRSKFAAINYRIGQTLKIVMKLRTVCNSFSRLQKSWQK